MKPRQTQKPRNTPRQKTRHEPRLAAETTPTTAQCARIGVKQKNALNKKIGSVCGYPVVSVVPVVYVLNQRVKKSLGVVGGVVFGLSGVVFSKTFQKEGETDEMLLPGLLFHAKNNLDAGLADGMRSALVALATVGCTSATPRISCGSRPFGRAQSRNAAATFRNEGVSA